MKNDLRKLNPCSNCRSKDAPTVVLFSEKPVEIKMRKHYLCEWKTVTCLKSKGGCGVSAFYFQDYDKLVDAYNESSEKGV